MHSTRRNNTIQKRGFLSRAAAFLLCLAMLFGYFPAKAFAAAPGEKKENAGLRSEAGTTPANTYMLEVCSGINDGSHVEYFCVEYIDQRGVLRHEYVFPHGELNTAYYSKMTDYGAEVVFSDTLEADSLKRREYVEDNMFHLTLPDFKKNAGGGLEASKTETFMFSLLFEMKSLEDISFFVAQTGSHASAGTKSDWVCQGLRLYKVNKFYGRQMSGYYSAQSYWAFDGTLLAQMTYPAGQYGVQFRADGSGKSVHLKADRSSSYSLDTELKGVDTAFRNAENNPEMLIRIDFADIFNGGIEALATLFLDDGSSEGRPQQDGLVTYQNVADLRLLESMALKIYYLDQYGAERMVSLPVISSFIGWIAQKYPSLLGGGSSGNASAFSLAGVAQQGDTLIFEAILPSFKEVTAFEVYVGVKKSRAFTTNIAMQETGILENSHAEVVNPLYDELVTEGRFRILESESASILAVSVYDPLEAGVRYSATKDGSMIYCHVDGLPVYAYTAGSGDGVPVESSGVKLTGKAVERGEGSAAGMLVLPSMDSSTYVVELCTDTVAGSDTRDQLVLALRYVDKNGKEHTTSDIAVEREAEAYLGCWPCVQYTDLCLPYLQGVQKGGRMYFTVNIPNLDHFTGATISILSRQDGASPESIDDWQMSFLNIFSGSARGRRHIEFSDEMLVFGDIYTNQTVSRSIDRSKRLISYNNKVLLDSGQSKVNLTFDESGNGGSEVVDTDDYNWEEISRKMSYNETKLNFGFTNAKIAYSVNVNVASNVGELASTEEYGDAGSVNHYYFQLVFENGRSAYVLANQQMTADGFRAGETERFTIYTNRNYGSLVAIHILPDDTIEAGEVYDKLKISSIEVEELSTRAVNRTWVFDDLGWVDIGYTDNGAQSTSKGQKARMESDMISTYLTESETYRINLMIAIATGAYAEGEEFLGSLSCSLSYERMDGTVGTTAEVDVAQLMAQYAQKEGRNLDLVDGYQRIDNSYMLQSNHTSRFFFSIENAHRLLGINFRVHGDGAFTWPIKEVDVYQVAESGALYRNNSGEYQQSGKVEFLCRSTNMQRQNITASKENTSGKSLSFTGNELSLDEENMEISIKRSPEIGTDKVNILVYPAAGTSAKSAAGVSVDLYYRRWNEQYETTNMTGFAQGDTEEFAYLSGAEITGMTLLDSLTVKAPADICLDHIVVTHTRNDVMIDSYYFRFDSSITAVENGKVEPQSGVKPQRQVLTFLLDENTDHIDLNPEKSDIAVSLIYISENSVNNEVNQSVTKFLTDFGYTEIAPGDLYRMSFEESDVREIIGYSIARTGNFQASVRNAVLTCYDAAADKVIAEYYFDDQRMLIREKDNILTTDVPLTLASIDMTVGSNILDNYAVDRLAMELSYTDSEGNHLMEVDDISDYLAGDSLTAGGEGTINILIPDLVSLDYVRIKPLNEDPELIAQWSLKHIEVSQTFMGQKSLIVSEDCDGKVYEGKGYNRNLRPVSLFVQADPVAVSNQTSFESTRIDLGTGNITQFDIDFREKIAFKVIIQNGLPEYGYTVQVQKQSAQTGEWISQEKIESYVIKTGKDSFLFNPPVVYGSASYRLIFTADELPDESITVQVNCRDMSLPVYYVMDIDFSELTEETLLSAAGDDIYVAVTYLPDKDSKESELRMTQYYRLSSLLGNIRGGASLTLPEAVPAGAVLRSLVVLGYEPEEELPDEPKDPGEEPEKKASVFDVCIDRIRLCEVDLSTNQTKSKGFVTDAPFTVSEDQMLYPILPETEEPLATDAVSAQKYVSKGLLAMFDGIENYAYGLHSTDAVVWRDLTGRITAELVNTNEGDWKDNSLMLNRSLYVQFEAELAANGTIEIVCDVPILDSSAQRQALFMDIDGTNGIYRVGKSLVFKNHGSSSAAQPSIKDYNGSSVIVLFNEKTSALGYSGVLALSNKENDSAGGAQEKTWIIGGQDSNYAAEGKIYAVRIYDRVLSEEELVQNYLYDRVRFFDETLEDALYDLNLMHEQDQDLSKDFYRWAVEGTVEDGFTVKKEMVAYRENTLTGTGSYSVVDGSDPFLLDVKASEEGTVLKYSSDNESVVLVDQSGKVTPVSVGKTVITVTADAFELVLPAEMKIIVEVTEKPRDNVISGTKEYVKAVGGETFALDAAAKEAGSVLSYESSDPAIAAVDQNGNVTPGIGGTAVITVKAAAFGVVREAEFKVSIVVKEPVKLVITGTNEYSAICQGTPFRLDVTTGIPAADQYMHFETSDKYIADVGVWGDIYPAGRTGEAYITVTVPSFTDGETVYAASDPFFVTIRTFKENIIKSSSPSGGYPVGGNDLDLIYRFSLAPKYKPSGVSNYLLFSSSDESIATVDEAGILKPLSAGKVTITVTAPSFEDYLEATLEITLTIYEPT